MTTESKLDVKVTRRFNVPPEQVFDAWLDSEMIGKWMFGPAVRDEEVMRLTLEPRVGGYFSFVVRRNAKEIEHVGEYLEIDRPRRLVFTWGTQDSNDRSQVTVDIAPMNAGSQLTLAHQLHPPWEGFAGPTEVAWAKMLDTLAATLEAEGRARSQ